MISEPDILEPEDLIPAALDGILNLHRDPKGWIGFVRKPDPKTAPRDKNGKLYTFQTIGSIQAGQLGEMLPGMRDWILKDSYFTVNAMYRGAPYANKLTGMPEVWRKEKHLYNLTACYVDVDCGRPESDEAGGALHWRVAQHQIEFLADNDIIPYPSMLARSGRGVYAFWLLQDPENGGMPPRAWGSRIQLYKKCNKALGSILTSDNLPVDKGAHDAARVLRVPGSLHKKAQKRVRYVLQLDEDGLPYLYTLEKLSAFLGIDSIGSELPEGAKQNAFPSYRKTQNKGTAPKRQKGSAVLHARRADDLLTVLQWRGGIYKRGVKWADETISPGRRFTLELYAYFLKGAGMDQSEALKAVESLAADCTPPYPSDETDSPLHEIVKASFNERRRWGNEKLCGLFGITPRIAESLDLLTILPEETIEKRKEEKKQSGREGQLIERRRFIDSLIRQAVKFPSLRDLEKTCTSHGFTASHETIRNDLKELGHKIPGTGGGRRRKQI